MTDATPSERRISAITETLWNLLRDCPPAEAVAALEIMLARARERAGMEQVGRRMANAIARGLKTDGLDDLRSEADTREAGLRQAAAWHRQRRIDTPDAFEMEFHEVSERAILAAIPAPAPPQTKTATEKLANLKKAFAENNIPWDEGQRRIEQYTRHMKIGPVLRADDAPAPAPPQSGEREVEVARAALDPFARAYRILHPDSKLNEEDGARDHMARLWPTIGDLRRANDALDALRARAGEA